VKIVLCQDEVKDAMRQYLQTKGFGVDNRSALKILLKRKSKNTEDLGSIVVEVEEI
jgi:hypothetical protein